MRLLAIAVASSTLQLPPGLAARLAMGADVAASAPAPGGTIWNGTKVWVGVDGAPATSGEGEKRRWRAGRLGGGVGSLLTGLAEWFVAASRKGLGFGGTFATRLRGLAGHLRGNAGIVGSPNMDDEAAQQESDEQDLGKP